MEWRRQGHIDSERVTGRKAQGPHEAGGNKQQVADFFFFPPYTKFKEASFKFCVVMTTPGSAWPELNISQTLS